MNAPTLRIATYNLQKCIGLDMRRRPGRSLGVIGALGADIVVLQEADKRLPPRPPALPHDMIDDAGWRLLPFGAPGRSLGWHGNAMLVRPCIDVLDTAHMNLPGLEPRGAIRAELNTSIGPLRVIGLHLGLIRRYRLQQLNTLLHMLARLPEAPTILAGDFNEWSEVALEARAPGFEFVPTPPSYPSPRPVGRLDRIAFGKPLRATGAGTHVAKPARISSDHLPVWADLQDASERSWQASAPRDTPDRPARLRKGEV